MNGGFAGTGDAEDVRTACTKMGRAAWDLFRAQDSDKIREFLKERFNNPSIINAGSTNGVHNGTMGNVNGGGNGQRGRMGRNQETQFMASSFTWMKNCGTSCMKRSA